MIRPGRQTRRAVWLAAALLCLSAAVVLRAQRELQWDALDVDASLDASGILHVTETQRMVFTGDWNGGERIFNLRPRQRLSSLSVERIDPATGQAHALTQDSSLDDVDEFSRQDDRTLRWRSRLPSDKPFSNDRLTYVIKYELSGILLYDGDSYRLDHDFAFPDRDGDIDRFSLSLVLDPVWQPMSEVQDRYAAGPLAPGQSFVLTVPLRYRGAGSPVAVDTRRPPAAAAAPWFALLVTAFVVAAFSVRESRLGRFKPVAPQQVDAEWVAQHILTLPAEVVGAAWDGAVKAPEVVALIARMVAEGKLVSDTANDGTLTLKLSVERASLEDYERALVDGLFFDDRATTSTALIKAHYKSTGFNPAELIAPGLDARVTQVLPSEDNPRVSWHVSAALLLGVFLLVSYELIWNGGGPGSFAFAIFAVFVGMLAKIPGLFFRRRIDWGPVAAVLCLLPALLASAALVAFLFTAAAAELSPAMVGVIAILAVWIPHSALNALKSRQNPAAIAFRKKLAAGRLFFKSQLKEEHPSLQDSWYPWVLAYGLAGDADQWSSRYATSTTSLPSSASSSTSTSPAGAGWTGFGGGRSGGAGGGATWAAAASGMAAGVASPSSSSSSGGGSSGGGSSGGGGGGGW